MYSVEDSLAMLEGLSIDLPANNSMGFAGADIAASVPSDPIDGRKGREHGESQFVFNPDNRTRVANDSVADYPWCANGRMWMTFPGSSSEYAGSGAMINRSFYITAGHCVFDRDLATPAWANQVAFSPGQDLQRIGSSYRRSEYQYFGEAAGVNLYSFAGWTESGNMDYDMAWVQLDRNMGDFTGWFGYGYNTDDSFYNGTANTAGYPGDLTPTEYDMWYQAGNARSYSITSERLQSNTMDVFGGQSGSGVYYSDGSSPIVHAVVSSEWSSGGTPLSNMFTRMTSAKFETISASVNGATAPTDRPDLVDYDAWFDTSYAYFSPGTVALCASLTVRSVVRNNGTAAAGSFSVRFRLSTDQTYDTTDYWVADATVSSLAAFNWADALATGTVPSGTPAGQYYLVWSIDALGEVSEFLESNNTGATSTRVTVQQAVLDLTAPGVSWAMDTLSEGTATWVEFQVKNEGTGRRL